MRLFNSFLLYIFIYITIIFIILISVEFFYSLRVITVFSYFVFDYIIFKITVIFDFMFFFVKYFFMVYLPHRLKSYPAIFELLKRPLEMHIKFTNTYRVVDVFVYIWFMYVTDAIDLHAGMGYTDEEYEDDEEEPDEDYSQYPLLFPVDMEAPDYFNKYDLPNLLKHEYFHDSRLVIRDDILEKSMKDMERVEDSEILDAIIWLEMSFIKPIIRFFLSFLPKILKDFFKFSDPEKIYLQLLFLLVYLPTFIFVFLKQIIKLYFKK